MESLSNIFVLLGGIGVFLVACDLMSDNLQALSSNRLKSIFAKISDNKIIGVFIGMVVTILISSSGACNVMAMGFVNAHIISLKQACTIVFGSEIGTTLTAQIVALGFLDEGAFSLTTLFSSLAGIGIFIKIIAKKEQTKHIANILVGFGMMFIGLSIMNSSMNFFAQLESLKTFLASIDSVLLMTIIGALLTAIMQSSTAITTIAIAMIGVGLIDLKQGIYITVGSNIGSCVTGMLAALNSDNEAKRVSVIQLIFNVGGSILVLLSDTILKLITNNSLSFSYLFSRISRSPEIQLASFHAIYNIVSVIIALPFTDLIVKTSIKVIPDSSNNSQKHLKYFDYKMLSAPSIAVSQIKNEIINMSKIAIENFNIAIEIITTLDFEKQQTFIMNEKELNYLNQNLVEIVSSLTKKTINAKDYAYLSSTYRAISDFERIGDYSENIVEYANHLADNNESFTKDALDEILKVSSLINHLYNISIDIYQKYDKKKFEEASLIEEEVDQFTEKMANNHINRLNNGDCNADIGSQYLQLSSDVERIADHLININDKDFIISH